MNDPDVYNAVGGGRKREMEGVELILLKTTPTLRSWRQNGSVFTNKYSEGYREDATTEDKNLPTLWKVLRLNGQNRFPL